MQDITIRHEDGTCVIETERHSDVTLSEGQRATIRLGSELSIDAEKKTYHDSAVIHSDVTVSEITSRLIRDG